MSRFERNRAFEAQFLARPETEAFLARRARDVAREVQAAAPIGKDRHEAFKRSIRAVGRRVITTDAFWHLIEFGSVNNPAYAPIRRGIRAAGLRLKDARD